MTSFTICFTIAKICTFTFIVHCPQIIKMEINCEKVIEKLEMLRGDQWREFKFKGGITHERENGTLYSRYYWYSKYKVLMRENVIFQTKDRELAGKVEKKNQNSGEIGSQRQHQGQGKTRIHVNKIRHKISDLYHISEGRN